MNNIPLIKIFIIAYILIFSSLLLPMFSNKIINEIKDNKIMQHILLFIFILIIVTEYNDEFDIQMTTFYSGIIYLWFIFFTKMDKYFHIIVFSVLLLCYFYQKSLTKKTQTTSSDDVLSEEEKDGIINDLLNKDWYLTIGIMSLIVGGMLVYSNKKEGQYGGGYSLINFLLY